MNVPLLSHDNIEWPLPDYIPYAPRPRCRSAYETEHQVRASPSSVAPLSQGEGDLSDLETTFVLHLFQHSFDTSYPTRWPARGLLGSAVGFLPWKILAEKIRTIRLLLTFVVAPNAICHISFAILGRILVPLDSLHCH